MGQTEGYALLFQEQNREVARKLGTATLCMFTVPIIAFYIGLYVLFPDKEEPLMWSGGLAVVFTNVVIAGYVVSAFSEEDDADEQQQRAGGGSTGGAGGGSSSGQQGSGDGDLAGPRVGAFKQRTD